MQKLNLAFRVLMIVSMILIVYALLEMVGESTERLGESYSKVDSLELRVQVLERIYREHLEECSFISKHDIEVGYDNYLRVRKDNVRRKEMKQPMTYDSIRH